MTLGEKQRKFTHMTALLILHAEQLGFRLTCGDAYRDSRCDYGHPNSLHRKRLAMDWNLFKLVRGRWRFQTSTEAHRPLGEYWESIGGSWGGRFNDGNHYSLEHGGVR